MDTFLVCSYISGKASLFFIFILFLLNKESFSYILGVKVLSTIHDQLCMPLYNPCMAAHYLIVMNDYTVLFKNL